MDRKGNKQEKAFLIGAVLSREGRVNIEEQFEELQALARAAGALTVGSSLQNRQKQDPSTFIGKGKAETIVNQAKELNCDLIIFNNDISPTQLKNLQKVAGENLKVIDRTGLILDIFTKHAKTREAKTQVQLAHLEYLLPRLTRQWTHLERQMGGIGTRAGAGETQIEIDRRLIRNQIAKLKKELKHIQKQRNIQNHGREGAYRVALLGYTNAGKSTLMQSITGAEVLIQDQLFATLDTTTRKLDLDVGMPVLLSDTVGFIRNLPHHLIASFRSTLGEIRDVNLLLKVFDVSSACIQDHIDTVDEVLHNLRLAKQSSLLVFNKIDKIDHPDQLHGIQKRFPGAMFISAEKNIGIDSLMSKIKDMVRSELTKDTFHITYKQAKLLDTIYALTHVLKKKEDYDGIQIEVEGSREALDKIRQIVEK